MSTKPIGIGGIETSGGDVAGRIRSKSGSPRSVTSFLEAQAVSSRRLGFSVTQACPLRCRHCSVSASPDLGGTTFTAEQGELIASQMPDLKAIGIDFVDFTGGEPTLAALFVQKVSRAAKEAGITCGIVTAGHWAASDAHAETFLSRFPDIEHWDISTDIYHREFVDVESVIRAFHTISKSRPTPLIRIAYHEPMTLQDAQLIDEVYRQVGERIAFQPVGPVGRGADLLSYSQVGLDQADMTPCPSTGPLVQTGGAVAPCCAPLSHESIDHPLRLGNAFTEPLTAIVTRWRRHPLLQTLRVWGFQPILQWLDEAGVSHASLLRHRVCHMCVELIRNEATCRLAAERASSFEHRIRLAYALLTIFNEPYLDNALRNEASEWLQINGDIEVSLL